MVIQYMKDHDLRKEQVLFMGDDIPDYVVMKEVGSQTPARIRRLSMQRKNPTPHH